MEPPPCFPLEKPLVCYEPNSTGEALPSLSQGFSTAPRAVFLQGVERVAPWAKWVELSTPCYSAGENRRPPCALETILRLSKPPDERYRRRKHKLADQALGVVNNTLSQRRLLAETGDVVDPPWVAAPTSTKNQEQAQDPEMRSSKKGDKWYLGMKAHVGADAGPGLLYRMETMRLPLEIRVTR